MKLLLATTLFTSALVNGINGNRLMDMGELQEQEAIAKTQVEEKYEEAKAFQTELKQQQETLEVQSEYAAKDLAIQEQYEKEIAQVDINREQIEAKKAIALLENAEAKKIEELTKQAELEKENLLTEETIKVVPCKGNKENSTTIYFCLDKNDAEKVFGKEYDGKTYEVQAKDGKTQTVKLWKKCAETTEIDSTCGRLDNSKPEVVKLLGNKMTYTEPKTPMQQAEEKLIDAKLEAAILEEKADTDKQVLTIQEETTEKVEEIQDEYDLEEEEEKEEQSYWPGSWF